MGEKPRSRTLGMLLEEMASRFGDQEALVQGDRRLSYRQLHAEVMTLARGLCAQGLERGDKVAILMGNRPEWVVTALATTMLGGVAVGLNSWASARELEYLVGHSDCRYIFAVPSFLRRDYRGVLTNLLTKPGTCENLEAVFCVDGYEVPDGWRRLLPSVDESKDPEVFTRRDKVADSDTAFLLYTSGSTSKPKGVRLLHGSLIENPWQIGERMGVSDKDRLWLAVSLFWGLGSVNGMMNLLTHGGCIVLQESFEAGKALEIIESEKCSVFYGTPNMAQSMFEHADRAVRDLSSLRTGVTIGTGEQIQRVIDMGVAEICNVYGLTETYGNSHVTRFDDEVELRLQSCGKPLPGVRQRIVLQSGEEAAVGEIGEIRIKGHITPGYYKDPEQTEQAFDADGFFKTGDLGYVDRDGFLYFKGRIKEMIKTGGINVSPAEVEAVISEHPDVYLAYAVGLKDDRHDEILAAIVVPVTGRRVCPEDVIQFCKARSAAYKVPRRVRVVGEQELPLTNTGKVQKQRIADLFFTGEEARCGV